MRADYRTDLATNLGGLMYGAATVARARKTTKQDRCRRKGSVAYALLYTFQLLSIH